MKSHVRVLSTILVITLAVLLAVPSLANAQVQPAVTTQNGQTDDCVAEIIEAVMTAMGIEDEDELIAYVDELEDEEIEALLEEAGVAELAETCEIDMGEGAEEIACEELAYDMLVIITEIEDEDELVAYLEELEDEEIEALLEEAALLLVQAILSEATGIEDVDELEAYLEGLEEEELETLFEETGINAIEEACADDDFEDLPEECLVDIFEVLVEATGIEDEDELLTYLDELDEEELDAVLDENGVYDIIDACEVEDSEADDS